MNPQNLSRHPSTVSALLACAIALASPSDRVIAPVIQLAPDGSFAASGVRLLPGTSIVSTPKGVGIDFNGDHCGIEITDMPEHQLTNSITVSTWIYLRSYVTSQNSAPGAQVLFRGDDRSGADPYHLTVLADGTIAFTVENEAGQGSHATAPIALLKWTHVVGSYDHTKGKVSLWLDGVLMSQTATKFKPYGILDQNWAPGIGIGNVQRSTNGAHNQPLNGQICDLRLYAVPLTPQFIGYASPARPAGFFCG